MKRTKYATTALERLSIRRLLRAARRTEALYLTLRGKVRHVIKPADDGDQEVCAMQNNAKLMAYLEKCVESARRGPTKSLEEVRKELGLPSRKRKNGQVPGRGSRPQRKRA